MQTLRTNLPWRTAIVVFLLSLFFQPVHSQTRFSGWLAANNLYRIPDSKFGFHLDVQARTTDQLEHLETFIFRPGFNWHFRKNMFATAGYAFVLHRRNIGGVSGYAPEHRIWQQLIINQPIAFIILQHRFRLEQRFVVKSFVQQNKLENGGNWFANRFRYFTRAVIPFNGQKPFVRGFFGAIQDEVFLNFGDKSNVNGKVFDQNRLYLATGYRVTAKFDVEVGYINQYISGRNDAFTNNHIFQLATYTRL